MIESSRIRAKLRFVEFMRSQNIDLLDFDSGEREDDDDLSKIVRKHMAKQLESDFGCDAVVARYALEKTNYSSIEEAVQFIFGLGDADQNRMLHPFFGYVRDDEYVPADIEQASQEVCFICEQPREIHEEGGI